MRSIKKSTKTRLKRKKRIRKKIIGTSERPRLTVFKSAKHIYAQVIDDTKGVTLVCATSLESVVKDDPDRASAKGKIPTAKYIGKLVAERALEKGIKRVVFDRNGFLYHGRVKAVSDGAREAGLDF